MKFYLLPLAMLAIAACSSDDNEVADVAKLAVDVSEIDVPAEGGDYILNLTMNGPADQWQSITPADGWITLTPDGMNHRYTGSSMTHKVKVTVERNDKEQTRSHELCLYTTYDRHTIKVTQAPLVREGCVELDKNEVAFTAGHYEYRQVEFTAYEDVTVTLPGQEAWIQSAEVPAETVPAGTKAKFYIAPDGPTATPRRATVTFTGTASGKTTLLTVTQEAIAANPAYPARWYYTNAEAQSSGWFNSGVAAANYDAGKNSAVITAVGVNNRRLGHIITTTYKESIGLSNLYTGDYLLFSLPVKELATGTGIDFMLTISGNDNSAPKYWICEILDGGQWKKPKQADLKQADGVEYSFYTKYFSSYQHCTFLQNFTLDNAVNSGFVQVRCRVVGNRNGGDGTLSPDNNGAVYLPSHEFHLCSMAAYPGIAAKDNKRVAILGNSFTHYFGSAFLLKEIARSQGHNLDIRAFAKGSQYLNNHYSLERSNDIIAEGGYDYVVLQEQSTTHDAYAVNHAEATLNENKALTAKLRQTSPSARIILENTWAFPSSNWNNHGSSAQFESLLLTGAKEIAQADPNTDWVSPIGVAFNAAYASGITDLWFTDSKHPNRNGAYLKSCVNYLVIFGEPFDANVTNGGCDATTAAKLRQIAEQTVLGHETDYFIAR